MKKRERRIILLLCILLGAAIILSAVQSLDRMDAYIKENGRQNMDAVISQMRQSYDVQMREYYIDLQQVDNYLFQNRDRSIQLEAYQPFFDARKQGAYDRLLFLKENGEALTEDGTRSRVELREQLLENIQNNRRVTKLIAWEEGGVRENCYLVALPCETFYVNGEQFTALGALYEQSRIDSMLEMSGYKGNAYLFLVDAQGYVSYTNQTENAYLRYYALLDHMLQEGALTQKEYNYLTAKLTDDTQEVLLLGGREKPFYLGFAPLGESDSKLVCIVPASAINNVLVGYRQDVVRFSAFMTVFTILLCAGLLYIVFRLRESEQKVDFEEKNRRIQAQAMEALEVEKSRAELANQAKSDFLSRMSHDVRTPMNAIVGTMDLIDHDADSPEAVRGYVQKVRASCRHLLSLINNVLDMSQMESTEVVLNRDRVSLAEELNRLERIAAPRIREKAQRFEIHVHNIRHEYLICDGARLQQILVNLLSNAVKFTPEGGSISLELTELPEEEPGKARLSFCVSDTGCGMTPEFLQRVFEPFARADDPRTSKQPSTGLGLAITQSIVDMMGGTIRAESELGVGSTFLVTLPLEIDTGAKYAVSAQNVLLITGDSRLAEDVRLVLGGANLPVETAATVVQAEKIIKEFRPDVIVLSGYSLGRDFDEVVRWVRAHSRNCPLVFCYGYRRLDQEEKILPQSNIDGVITGPFFFETFAGLVNQARGDVVQPEEKSCLAGKKFLCAEDNESNVDILKALLELEGASCDFYTNGAALVKAFASVKQGDYDAILMDIQMPVMNGLDATRAIRSGKNPLGKRIPIIAMTANVFTSDVRSCLEAGMTAHVSKPLDMKVLKETLSAIFGKGDAQ